MLRGDGEGAYRQPRNSKIHELEARDAMAEMDGRSKAHELITRYNTPRIGRAKAKRKDPEGIGRGAAKIANRETMEATFAREADARARDDTMSSDSVNDTKLKALQKRIEKIREEKDRLERLQHLKLVEEQTKRDILEAQKQVVG
jgi:hypothetical protein